MIRLLRTLPFTACWLIVLVSESFAQHAPGQVETYRNFDYVRTVTVSNSSAYFGTTGGVIRYDRLRQLWSQPLTGADGTPPEPIQHLWVDRFDQNLYLGTELGLYEYDSLLDNWTPVFELPPLDNDIKHVRAPDVLMPQFNALYQGRGEFIDFYSRHFATTDIVEDASGDLWIGTWGYGPAHANASSGLMDLLPYGLLQNQVDVILPDDSVLWLAGPIRNDFRTGITGYYPLANRFSYMESGLNGDFPATDITCLAADSARLFVGTPHGFYRINKSDLSTRGPFDANQGLPDDSVVSLAVTGKSLYVGTVAGLSLIKLGTDSLFSIRPETFHGQIIYDMDVVGNTVWIASSAGAFRYTPETDRLQQFQDSDLVLFSAVLNVKHLDSSVWLAADAGVVKLNLVTGKWESFREPSSARDRRPLAVNQQLIALAVDRGVELIIPGPKKNRTVTLTTDDGLASDDVRSLYLSGDYLWVGTDNGLTRFMWNDPRWID